LLVFKGALLQFKPSIDEKYNQIKKIKKLEKLLKRLESIVEEVNLQEESIKTIESDSELRNLGLFRNLCNLVNLQLNFVQKHSF